MNTGPSVRSQRQCKTEIIPLDHTPRVCWHLRVINGSYILRDFCQQIPVRHTLRKAGAPLQQLRRISEQLPGSCPVASFPPLTTQQFSPRFPSLHRLLIVGDSFVRFPNHIMTLPSTPVGHPAGCHWLVHPIIRNPEKSHSLRLHFARNLKQ